MKKLKKLFRLHTPFYYDEALPAMMALCLLFVLLINAVEIVKPLIAAVIIDDFLREANPSGPLVNRRAGHRLYPADDNRLRPFCAAGELTARVSQSILDDTRRGSSANNPHDHEHPGQHGTGRLITRAPTT
jgi:hypothetical protein